MDRFSHDASYPRLCVALHCVSQGFKLKKKKKATTTGDIKPQGKEVFMRLHANI